MVKSKADNVLANFVLEYARLPQSCAITRSCANGLLYAGTKKEMVRGINFVRECIIGAGFTDRSSNSA